MDLNKIERTLKALESKINKNYARRMSERKKQARIDQEEYERLIKEINLIWGYIGGLDKK